MTFKKCFLLATTFSLLLVAVIAVAGADRAILAAPSGQAGPSTSTPTYADWENYTVDYVNRAIDLYDQRGLEAVQAYYNSAESHVGEWYLFAIDENDIYVLHGLLPHLIGTDIKLVVDSTGYELGKDIAKATEAGRWIEYLWPHPATLTEVPKVAYAKRHDGYVFASGYYPVPGEPAAYTQGYVQKAIDKYDSDGLDATVSYYNSRESLDNQWYLRLLSVADKTVLADGLPPNLLVGANATDLTDPQGFNFGQALLAAPEDGYWFQMSFFSSLDSGVTRINVWAVRRDGYIFASSYFTGVIAPPSTPTPTATGTPMPTPTPEPIDVDEVIAEDPFGLLVAILSNAYENGYLSDTLSGLLVNLFIDSFIMSNTGETREEVVYRIAIEGPAADRAALVALFNATNGANWDKNGNWLTDEPLSEWYGITTDLSGRVTKVELGDNDLRGALPAELGNLANLTTLDLRRNRLDGEIPPELGNLSNLTTLYLFGTKISGEIPRELANLTNLEKLLLYSNDLSGEIPAWLAELTNLKVLDLDDNAFTGEIPAELGNLTELEDLWLARNKLSGPIPPEFGDLTELNLLMLFDNELSGSIPAELGNLSKLEWMYLSDNKLSGSIPAELGNLAQLERLSFWDNQLSGSIPAELGNLSELVLLSISDNKLSGSIPAELGNLPKLERMYLYDNELTGPIPYELGSLSSLKYLFLRNNQLTGSIPYELGSLSKLEILSIRNNQLSGSIPYELGNLTNLEGLTLSDNELSGRIPAELGNLSNLETLYISGNRLTGCIPSELRDVSDNDFEDLDPLLPFCDSEGTPSGASSNTGLSAENPILMPVKVIGP